MCCTWFELCFISFVHFFSFSHECPMCMMSLQQFQLILNWCHPSMDYIFIGMYARSPSIDICATVQLQVLIFIWWNKRTLSVFSSLCTSISMCILLSMLIFSFSAALLLHFNVQHFPRDIFVFIFMLNFTHFVNV